MRFYTLGTMAPSVAQSIPARLTNLLRDFSPGASRSDDSESALAAIAESSIDLVRFCVAVEREFGFRFTLGEIAREDFRTFGGLTKLVAGRATR